MSKNRIVFAIFILLLTQLGCKTKAESEIQKFEIYVSEKEAQLGISSSMMDEMDLSTIKSFQIDSILSEIKAPNFPIKEHLTQIPDKYSDELAKYSIELERYFQNRQKLKDYFKAYKEEISLEKTSKIDKEFADLLYDWNNDIFWAPASKSKNRVTKLGDEVRAVFGPIPDFNVKSIGTYTDNRGFTVETVQSLLQVDGNIVKLKPNPNKPNKPLEFEHRNINGDFVKWTETVEKCDKPSMAGGVTPCGTASRISVIRKGNIEWIALARKSLRVDILRADEYWLDDNTKYALIGYIGFNTKSGEVAFFDGNPEEREFYYDSIYPPPGGYSYNDPKREVISTKYDKNFNINCAHCHDNKDPRTITPYLKDERVGFRSEQRIEKLSIGDLMTDRPHRANKPYRIIGTELTLHPEWKKSIDQGRMITDPSRKCTRCHGLSSLGTRKFTYESLGRLNEYDDNNPNTPVDDIENNFRTDWALRSGQGKIHPWMVPDYGNEIWEEPLPDELSEEDWQALKRFIDNPKLDPNATKTFNRAPAPEEGRNNDTRIADNSSPKGFNHEVIPNENTSLNGYTHKIRFSWEYLNSLGGVPERDDVRFNASILEVDISDDLQTDLDYPTIEQTMGTNSELIRGEIFKDDTGDVFIIKNISYKGHLRFTEPAPTNTDRLYEIIIPAKTNKRYLIRILPKRFSFDQSGEIYSNKNHIYKPIDILPPSI